MAVAVLANKTQLARLAVPTTLLLQTAQTIQQRLGGLVGREIRHVPFSRRTSTAPDMLRLYSQHHHEILSSSGIMLTTPEHILSYKLSGLQCLADSRLDEARDMVRFQSWLDQTSRLVIDEADVALAVKTRLIYPSGPQISVDGHPHRWLVAQALLALVEGHVPDLQRDFPRSIEVVTRPGGFPIMHFLHTDVEDALIKKITNDVCDGRIALLRPDKPASGWEAEIRHLLSARKIEEEMVERVSASFADAPSAKKIILLLRGLLFHGILLLCLKRRWNVQYGLDARRDPIAVPFDAKGVPSEQSEFGHPDVAILLTCLAFYYAGLDVSQFQESLQRVLKSDDPAIEYENWTQGADSLPESLRHWNVVNGDDQGQTGELWQHLRLSRSVLDYYMNSSVFPMHARQFATNLQASGWDIPVTPQLDASGGSPRVGTTGFSGTNDNKTMLPLNIRQDDLPGLRQTNAEVLTYLLQGRNRRYCLAAERGRRLTSDGLLRRITGMGIRILIDAGAYILEMDNRSLVKAWLDIDTKAKGALYFGADNRAWIQYRGGKEAVPLLATPFAESLEECLVYFDEAHTRGIDLKLPKNSTGALTLAPGQTKDQTVQGKPLPHAIHDRTDSPAGMRMRYLGTSQCIVFFAPPEVNQNIIDVVQKRCGPGADVADINSSHVVMWLLEQTCCANDHLKKLYLAQGADYCHSMDAQWRNPNFLTEKRQRQAYLEVIQHPGHRNLDQLYGTLSDSELRTPSEIACAEFRAYMEKLGERTESHVGGGYVSALDEVEQERQVECQIEEVRQVQRRIHYTALTFPGLHLAISHFVQTGELEGNSGYEHVFAALGRTGVGQRFQIQPTRSRLFISTEFMRTAACGPALNDDFLVSCSRPM
jgi:hypothetical protein